MKKFVGGSSLFFAIALALYTVFASTPDLTRAQHLVTGWFLVSVFGLCAYCLLKKNKPELVTVTTNTSAVIHKTLRCRNCGGSEIESVEL